MDRGRDVTLQAPPLYPDELVSSAIIRCCRRYGLPLRRLRRDVLESPFWQPRFLCIGGLPALARVFRLPEGILLWEHSTFPYATAYLDDSTFLRALSYAKEEGEISRLGAITQNATVGQGFRRYCPACAAVDLRERGETYWHRSHNLPGVVACAVHETYLHVTRVPLDLSSRLALDLPRECPSTPAGRGRPTPALIAVASASAEALNTRPGSRPGAVSAATYRSAAMATGWLREGAQVSSEGLNELLDEVFGQSYLTRWLNPRSDRVHGWPALMLRDRTGVPFIPLKHILLGIAFRTRRTYGEATLSHRSSGPSARKACPLDAACSRSARTVLQRLRASGAINVTTESFLREAGCWQTYRHRLAELPRLRAVVLKFRASTMSVKQLRPGRMLYKSQPSERVSALP